jgi:mannose-6-phosphate isomerase-like protein (cupin superfamily)
VLDVGGLKWVCNRDEYETFAERGGLSMVFDFPEPIRRLPLADVPIEGCTAYLSQHSDHQILFMKFEKDVEVPAHSHRAQWGTVLSGRIDLTIGGKEHVFAKGDNYFIPEGVVHSANIHGGYADVTFFDQKDRYAIKGD